MKKILMLYLSIFLMLSVGFSQALNVAVKPTQKSTTKKELVQKADVKWEVQFLDTLNPSFEFPMGSVSDGTYLYIGSSYEDKIFISDFNSNIIDSIEINGMPGPSPTNLNVIGLAYDGQYLYMTNSHDTIYQIDILSGDITNKIPLPSNTYPLGITYAPDADNGNGAFWVSVITQYGMKLFSKSGTLLDSIYSTDMNYSNFYGNAMIALAYDDITPGGPFIYSVDLDPHYVICINPATKKLHKMIYNISQEVPNWDTIQTYSIYIQEGVYPGSPTLGIINILGHHIGYDLASTDIPDLGLTVVNSYTKPWLKIGENAKVSAVVYRSGKATITSCDFNFSIDDKIYTQALSGLNISDVIPFTLLQTDSTFSFDQETSLPMQIWFSNLNGIASVNSDTFELTIDVFQNAVQRKVLHEVFTSATCGPCKLGNEVLKSILDANDDIWTCIKYQMSGPGSGGPYYTIEGGTRANYYQVTGIPYLASDGNFYNDLPTFYSTSLLIEQSNKPSFVSIEPTFITQSSKKFDASLSITPYQTYTGNYKLFVALVESITRMNTVFGGNGETEFHYVMKKFMTDVNGNAISLAKDQTVNVDLSYEFKGKYRLPINAGSPINHDIEHSVENFNNIMLVYWIQEYDTKDVLQSGKVDHAVVSINDYATDNKNVKVFPNPSDGQINISSTIPFTHVSLRNMLGQEVYTMAVSAQTYHIQTNDLAPGLYILQLKTEQGLINKKISIK